MENFYDKWLKFWDDGQEERARARKFLHEEEQEWVRTKQDFKATLLCGRENGFITAGAVMLAVIPWGWNTGKHSHGEEAMFILQGKGFTILDGERYDWDGGSCLFMPYGSVHQHFNSGEEDVRYLSITAVALERFAGLARIDQYEEAGETYIDKVTGVPAAAADIHPELGRIVLRLKDAPVTAGGEMAALHASRKDEFHQTLPKEMRTAGGAGHRSRSVELMVAPENQFKAREVQITHVLCDEAGGHSGKHAHMEAVLYVLQGEGYSIIDGERIPWKRGTLLHVPGPQTVHQHFNTGKVESQQLRIHYGLRSYFYQPIARRVFPYRYYEFSSYGPAGRDSSH
ncbi:MAG: cupin domain-containing protein [Chloroflexi bacterium]|nr:cupin domain-containing protein [Chloroflexota bacterium]